MIARISRRILAFFASFITAFYARLVPAIAEAAIGALGSVSNGLTRSVEANRARLAQERDIRESLYESVDASHRREDDVWGQISRAERIRQRIDNLLA